MELETNVKRMRVMTYFIEATQRLIQQEGINSISIRKIATEAGYNSATLYNYFYDLEYLILFASVRYLREYVTELGRALNRPMNAMETYRTIYLKFSEVTFRSPEIFHNMFFGRHSSRLDEVFQQYFELFPSELAQHTGFVKSMLSEGNIYQRDRKFMDALVAEGFVAPEKSEMTVQAMVRTHQSFLYDAWMFEDTLDVDEHVKRFMTLFEFIVTEAR